MSLPPLYRVDELRALETLALAQHPQPPLMVRAGQAAAELARQLLGESGRSILVLAGPGNNGGDAFELAVELKRAFYRVDVVFAGDAAKLPADAAAALGKWNSAEGRLLQSIPPHARYDLVVDGLFGIGIARRVEGRIAALIAAANALAGHKLALDIPSGIQGDTGAVMGSAFRATHTLSFIAGKPGLYTLDGPDYCGELHIDALHLEAERLAPPAGRLLSADLYRDLPLARPRNFHKGRAGTVAVVGGANGMVGACVLAARAALKLGSGKVLLALLADVAPGVDYVQPELMLRTPAAALAEAALAALAIGPGMGGGAQAQRLLAHALRLDIPVVADADALNMIAAYGVLQSAVQARKAATLMTPHPAEAARLLGISATAVQADRIAAALQLAARFHALVALKGNGTVIAAHDGRWWINATGNAGMASAGMGDTLTGMVVSLLGQGLGSERALTVAVHLHGAAGDALADVGRGPLGMTASELADSARALLNRHLSNVR